MNRIDVALVVLLLLCAVRGFWRGVFRESFGFVGLIAGLVAALRFSQAVSTSLAGAIPGWGALPDAARLGIAFVATFIVVQTFFSLFGYLLDRTVGSISLQRIEPCGRSPVRHRRREARSSPSFFSSSICSPSSPVSINRSWNRASGARLLTAASSLIRAGLREAPAAEPDERV